MLNWRLLASLRIQAAMERGEFDDLPGQGQPLEWLDDTLVPPEWRLAFNLLKRADLAPEWIMRDAEIRADLQSLEEKRQQEQFWMEERRAAMASMSPEERAAERARLEHVQAQTWEQLHAFIEEVNRKIGDFNLIVPIVWLQRRPLDLAKEKMALEAAWGPLREEGRP